MKRREYLKQAAFLLALIAAAGGLLLIVPRNKALLWAIIGTVLILFAYSSLNMLRSRRVRIDHAASELLIDKPLTRVNLRDLSFEDWHYVHQRTDVRVTTTSVIKLLGSGLFLKANGRRVNLANRIDEEDYRFLTEHCGAPVVCICFGKHAQCLRLGDNKVRIKDLEFAVRCSPEELRFLDTEISKGALRKEKTATLRLSKWGGSFRIGKTPLSYEMVRPFTVFI